MIVEPSSSPLLRTYVAELKLDPSTFDAATAMTPGVARHEAAFQAMDTAEHDVMKTLTPKLEQLKAQGLVTAWDPLTRSGTIVITTPEAKANAAWQAIRGVEELSLIIRQNAPVKVQSAPAQPPAPSRGVPWQTAKVNAPGAWTEGATGEGVTIGFVDSGADPTHDALRRRYRGAPHDHGPNPGVAGAAGAGKARDDYNFVDELDGDTALHDEWGHGTNVISVAVGDAPGRHVGVAPKSNFIVARTFGMRPDGATGTVISKLRGLGWMLAPTDSKGENPRADMAPDVVNMSFGDHGQRGLLYRNALHALEAAGTVTVAAAGNGGRRGPGNLLTPAALPTVLGVGFTDRKDQVDPRSANGPADNPGADASVAKPDVVGPGTDVIAATKGGGYASLDGSSLSSGIASGVAALILSKYPTLTPEQVRTSIREGAVDIGAPGADVAAGSGRIDALAALHVAAGLVASSTTM